MKVFKTFKTVPGVVIAVQTFGDFFNFNPHLHVIATDGCFKGDGDFIKSVLPQGKDVEKQAKTLHLIGVNYQMEGFGIQV
uniref:transposase n=1 Tax=Acetivibrio cellulolyticus TaxID=35830 RepID=UPI003898EC85